MQNSKIELKIDNVAKGAKILVSRANAAAGRMAWKTLRAADGAETKLEAMTREGEHMAKAANKLGHVVASTSSKVVRAAHDVAQRFVHDARKLATRVDGVAKATPSSPRE